MAESRKTSEEPRVWRVCKKEIPRSAAGATQGRDYAYYYGGPDCEQRAQPEQHNSDHVARSD